MLWERTLKPSAPSYIAAIANGTYTGPWLPNDGGAGSLQALMDCAQSATLTLQGSDDQTTVIQTTSVTGTGRQVTGILPATSKFYRVKYLNGGTNDLLPLRFLLWTVAITAGEFVSLDVFGTTGATSGFRITGATTGGAPLTGLHTAGEVIIDLTGGGWLLCLATGTPGTWVTVGGTPSGPAGGVLNGTYPNPGFAVDMATQAELDAVKNDPLVFGLISNLSPYNPTAGAVGLPGNGVISYTRVTGAGYPITNIRLKITVSGGNLCVATYSRTGVGDASRPNARQSTSGTVPTPSAGTVLIAIAPTVTPAMGDYLAFGTDSAAVRYTSNNLGYVSSGDVNCMAYSVQTLAIPCPANATIPATVPASTPLPFMEGV